MNTNNNHVDWKGKWIQRYYPANMIPDPNVACEWYRTDPTPLFRKQFAPGTKKRREVENERERKKNV